MTYWILQHRSTDCGVLTEYVYQTTILADAADFVDMRNEDLAQRVIPSDVGSWSYTTS